MSFADAAAQQDEWGLSPYRIQAIIAIDAPGRSADQFAAALPTYLSERVETAIGPVWELETQVAAGVARYRLLHELDTLAGDPSAEFSFAADKLVLLAVRWTPDGYELAAREYDRYVERWSATIRRQTRQRAALAEQLFALLRQVVAPLAQFEVALDDEHAVTLTLRGAALPQKSAATQGVEPGDVFLPIFRRTTREGQLLPDGIQAVPWTYVETVEVNDAGHIAGRIHSGTRRPFGVRRRGRVEQVAIALRADPADTIVHLVSRSKPEKSLVGYIVYAQNAAREDVARIGVSDRDGRIRIAPGQIADSPLVGEPAPPRPPSTVTFLFVKNGGELLARLPIVPGAEPQVEVPLPDDDVRLRAEARLAALREELVDVVARRTILLARARQKIETGEFPQAQKLLAALDQLPGRSQFAQDLARERRLHRADDPQVQKRIEQLIAGTEAVVGQYLDARPVRELQEALRNAQNNGSE